MTRTLLSALPCANIISKFFKSKNSNCITPQFAYAPNPGDIWAWKAGKRIDQSGCFRDRYLYLPARLDHTDIPGSTSKRRRIFASKQSLERYVQEYFPDTDLDEFFASFSWKMHATESATIKEQHSIAAEDIEVAEDSLSECQSDITVCEARNKNCDSLTSEVEKPKYLPDLPCDIFCNQPGFCHDCCCILCCKTVDLAHGGYSYIKCQAKRMIAKELLNRIELAISKESLLAMNKLR
ncbi:hypothetical protein K1719_016188 [Acacia pycnantha]|nr:hypothetical protein K1719_016188 [Acacia pycnantha]